MKLMVKKVESMNMKRKYLSALITLLVIGFAVVATNLVINSNINIGFNKKEFNEGVIFTHTNTYNGEATINENKKKVTFNTTKLEDVNQQSILDFYVTNKSLQYDASVTINCGLEAESESYKDYIKIEQDLESPFNLESGDTRKGRLTITLIKAYTQSEEQNISMVCKLVATPKERTSKETYIPVEPQYEEIFLKGTDPVLEGTEATAAADKKLIPVKISDGGVVTRADTKKEWYNYENKEWANAVILVDGKEDPGANQTIQEQDIESYFVWIPKYRYKLWNVGTDNPIREVPFEIEVEFGTQDTTDEEGKSCTTPLNTTKTQALSGDSGQCDNNEWMTHPAFITMGVNGFWVGKFEVGYRGATSKKNAEKNEISPTKVIVKPNAYSWRNITVKNMFNSLLNYATNLDSHMMKNTEWGAVAYLSHSVYGINDEVAQNTNSEFRTGYAKTTDSSIVPYPSQSGFIASTTGNITGVYDMSAGSCERVAAYRDVENPAANIASSGFTKQEVTNIGEKYFDVYDSTSTNTSYEKRILGDATGEMGPFVSWRSSWYEDLADFVKSDTPWFYRGGVNSDISDSFAGQFYFSWNYGGTALNWGSRLVLSPQ